MNLFDQLVSEALKNQPELTSLRIVVEKELLHHDVIRILSQQNFLESLTFIGGTCLRTCYGGIRLSEDLDFTGGKDFTRNSLSAMGDFLVKSLHKKYGLHVVVTEPVKDKNNVDTWKIKIETRPAQKNIPIQQINIDICRIPSYERKPMLLLNPYGIDMGTSGLIIQAQSREEIYADKLLAFALRPNKIKHRDLWDIAWLHQQGIKPRIALIQTKLQDRHLTLEHFSKQFNERQKSLSEKNKLAQEFKNEMHRFLPSEKIRGLAEHNQLWQFIIELLGDLNRQINRYYSN